MARRYGSIPKISDGLLALKLLGPRLLLQKLRHQIYSQNPFLRLGKELEWRYHSLASHKGVTLLPASSEDVAQFFQTMAKESKESRYELLVRRRFYEKGFHDCYIGRATDSGEICSIVWMVTSRDVEKTKSENLYPGLRQDEVFGEHIYTLEKFRGKGVMNSTGRQHEEIARERGFKRMLFHVKEDNIPSLKSSIRRGHLVYQRLVRCRFLFHVKMKIIDHFDPAIPISIPDETQ